MFIGNSQESDFMTKVLKEARKIELKKIETIIKPPYYALKFMTDENLADEDVKKKVKSELVKYIFTSDRIKKSLIEALKKEGKSEEEANKIVNDKWSKEVIAKTVKMKTEKGKDGKWRIIMGYMPVAKKANKQQEIEFTRRIQETLDTFVLSESDIGQNSVTLEEAEKIINFLLSITRKRYGK